jgi:hypothetical protein
LNEFFDDHPVQLISDLQERWSGLTLSFSHYVYRPQSPFDERRVFDLAAAEVTPDWLHSQLRLLPEGWDLALNSRIKDARARIHHLPMIDFAKRNVTTDDLVLMRSVLGGALCRTLVFYESGRSLHAYGMHLLEPGAWREFMGRLLLLNLPQQEPLIDTRWVGHRLVSGYAALRWSSNSAQYLRVPAKTHIEYAGADRMSAGSIDKSRIPVSEM